MPFVSGHKHDLFLSYSHEEAAWIEVFTKTLCDEFQVRFGEPVTLWKDSQKLRLGQKWASEIEEDIRNAAAFLAIVSPTYLRRSPWCARERAIALENELDALKVESFYRFLKIIKTPGPGKAHEEMLGELQDIRFFNRADDYELAAGSPEYIAAIRACVRHIWELLRLMSDKGQEVYLAPGSIEMHDQREELKTQLKDLGFTIQPEVLLDDTFGKPPVRKAMENVSHALFILGPDYPRFTARQVEMAQELGKPMVFWVQPGEKQKEILERINALKDLPPGSEVLGGRSIRELVPKLLEKLKPPKEMEDPPPASGLARVYLNYDNTLSEDSRIAADIGDVFRARNFEVVQSGRDGDHDRLMRISHGVLLFRAANPTPDQWLKLNAMELAQAAQIFEKQPDFDAKALLVTEPARIRTHASGTPVYPYTEPFAPETLQPFFDRLQRASSVDGR